jgi:hypothetical protein
MTFFILRLHTVLSFTAGNPPEPQKHLYSIGVGMQNQLDARLLKAFHAVDLEDMHFIVSYVERMAKKRTGARAHRSTLKLVSSSHTPLQITPISDTSGSFENILALAKVSLLK